MQNYRGIIQVMESEIELGFINYPFYNKGSIIESVVYDNDPTEKGAPETNIYIYES